MYGELLMQCSLCIYCQQSRCTVNCWCNARFVYTVNDFLRYKDSPSHYTHHPTLIFFQYYHTCTQYGGISFHSCPHTWADIGGKHLKWHRYKRRSHTKEIVWLEYKAHHAIITYYIKIANKSCYMWNKIRGETNWFLYCNFNQKTY